VIVTVAGWGFAALLLLPHLTLLLVSFVPVGTWTIEPVPPAYTLRNYLTLLQDPVRARPLANSLWLATVATIAAVAIALAGALVAGRRRVRGGRAIETLLALPWAVPGTVFAIALATAFSVRAPWAGRVVLVGTIWILPLAYLVRNLPITSRAVLAGVRALDPSLDEAAATLGARRGRTLRRITLPLLRPALLAGASLAFVTAFGDFVTSIMLYTYDTRPVSLEILSSLRQADVGVAAAYGVVLMLVSAGVFVAGADRGGAG
jgi:iron(III) transport system permease protein